MTDFILTEADKMHPLWLRMKAYFEERLARARQLNDAVQPEDTTAALRGEIRCLRGLISLGDDRPIVTGADDA